MLGRFSREALQRVGTGLCGTSIVFLAIVAAGSDMPVVEPLLCHVVDVSGNPIAGVEVGVGANFGVTGNAHLQPGNDGWLFRSRAISDRKGLAALEEEKVPYGTVIVARHSKKGLIGYSRPRSQNDTGLVTITLEHAHQLNGELTCADLTQNGRTMPRCSIQLIKDGNTLARYFSRDGQFSFPVSTGKFKLRAYGNVFRSTVQEEIEITDKIHARKVRIDLPAKRLVLLEGTVAPPFQDVITWKNGPAAQPSAFRGDYLLIDFWGHWCGPCLRNMPHLIDLYEQFAGKGLAIIGAHVDNGKGVDSVQKLDDRLSVVRKQLWGGRDIPFPVALLRSRAVPGSTRNDDDARSTTAAEYGVASYPTCILVDPDGRIVREYRPHNAQDREYLRELLAQRLAGRE